MFRLTGWLRQSTEAPTIVRGGIKDFVDSSYINNKRPKVPGGPWPTEMLRKKSMGDLQQIWFMLVRERNMLQTMKDHYTRHQEELGAWPAPSRMQLVEESMDNLKRVLRERDNKANDAAVAIFKERLAQRIYRYPPGPQAPPGSRDPTSRVTLRLSRHVGEERVLELFGRYDAFDEDRGVVSVTVRPAPETLAAKEKAEEEFARWYWENDDAREYHQWSSSNNGNGKGGESASEENGSDGGDGGLSCFDTDCPVELAPGEFLSAAELEAVRASAVPVPPPLDPAEAARRTTDMLERIRMQGRTYSERAPIQLGYFPNITVAAPPPPAAFAATRPAHPDEILGPWEATIVYAARDGAEYARQLGVQRIDGADVLELVVHAAGTAPAAADCALYDEVLAIEDAATAKEKGWPDLPEWDAEYDKILSKKPEAIIQHNWQNSVDYMEREALLTGRSMYEVPIPVDPTCGEQVHIPPFARKPQPDFPKPDHLHTNI
jgi:large subunit ribosomal protein L47